jgi:hypothetical protein
VAKVKKAGAVRVVRSRKKAKAKNAPSGARKIGRRKPTGGKVGRRAKVKVVLKRAPPPPTFRVTALDPQKKCGAGTSVQELFRVSEESSDGLRSHLVFFDRHGWYCEHGRDCPAVLHAKKFSQKGSKVSSKVPSKVFGDGARQQRTYSQR